MMYYTAEWLFDDKVENDAGLISANNMREAGEWAQTFYGDDLISICFTPIEDPFMFPDKATAESMLKNQV